MELLFMFIVGFIVFILAINAIIIGVTYRIKSSSDDLKEEVLNLKKRINELEQEKKN